MTMKTMQLIFLKAIFVTVITVGPIGIAHAFQAEAPVCATLFHFNLRHCCSRTSGRRTTDIRSAECLGAPIALYPDALVAQVLRRRGFS
jgi:hypothetical protein